jgi:hypothetical protein
MSYLEYLATNQVVTNLQAGTTAPNSNITPTQCISELIRVSFNIFMHSNESILPDKCVNILKSIIGLAKETALLSPPLQNIHEDCINAMLNIPVKPLLDVWFPANDYSIVHLVLDIFEKSVDFAFPNGSQPKHDILYLNASPDQVFLPTLLLLTKWSKDETIVKQLIKSKLLPQDLYIIVM